jgi:lactoylglutathione lyase
MSDKIQYVHTNIVARDWKKLADFYINVFNCKIKAPERDLSGEWLEALTGIKNVRIRGVHLELPGYENGPTLEIFSYEPECSSKCENKINKQGIAHTAFNVDNFDYVVEKVLENGGSLLGEIVSKEYEKIGTLKVVYCRDPEENFIEIQQWS